MTDALSAAIAARVDAALAAHEPGIYPPHAFAKERALLVYADDALFAYYLGTDGRVFVLDMDRFLPQLEHTDNPDRIRATYIAAAAEFPELAPLADLAPR